MSFSNLWALIRALFIKTAIKGVINLPTTDTATDASAAVDTGVSTGTVVSAAADVSVSTAAPDAAESASVAAAATGTAETVAPADSAIVLGSLVAAAAVAAPAAAGETAATAAAVPVADEEEDEEGGELENIKALAGDGVELFATVFKEAMSLAIALGHDFESAFDVVKTRAQDLVAKL